MTWQHHRTRSPRNCDECPPRHPAVWNFNRSPFPTEYLCDQHARRLADAYGIEPPPVIEEVPRSTRAR